MRLSAWTRRLGTYEQTPEEQDQSEASNNKWNRKRRRVYRQ